MSILNLLEFEEGYREEAYLCSNGYPTIGIGWKLGAKCNDNDLQNYYGNMRMSHGAALAQCSAECNLVEYKIVHQPNIGEMFEKLAPPRQDILVSMAYQMGICGLLGFKNMLTALSRGDYATAAYEGLDSKWARDDSPERARRHMAQLESGCVNPNYQSG